MRHKSHWAFFMYFPTLRAGVAIFDRIISGAAITALMSFAGLCLGRAVGHLIHIRADLLSGIALVVMAVVLAL